MGTDELAVADAAAAGFAGPSAWAPVGSSAWAPADSPGGLLSLLNRRAPTGPAADPRRPRWGKKRVEVARDAAGDPGKDRQARRRGPG
jgi:hypothetical protein